MNQLYTLGIDVGSTTSKCVILKDGKEFLAKALVPAGTGTTGPSRARQEVMREAGLSNSDIVFTLATGYGRQAEGIADDDMSELSCHAMGAHFLNPGTRTVIDIGGQDIKVLSIDGGSLVSFQMNDKCAAGTGRFLEVMARVLEVEVDQLAELSARSEHPVQISSTCTVFAESEVISQLSKGAETCDIVAGIHRSVISKVIGLVHRVGLREPVMLTGGVSRNSGVVRALEEALHCRIWTSELSQYAGAIGAALFGYQKARKKRGERP
jgi:predicted CoA-substrate-specific enzyme activase